MTTRDRLNNNNISYLNILKKNKKLKYIIFFKFLLWIFQVNSKFGIRSVSL